MSELKDTPNQDTPFSYIQNSLEASSRFVEDTWKHPNQRFLQAAAAVDGIVIGGLKAAPDRIINHPKETLAAAVGGAGIGALCGAAAAIESPLLIAGVAVGMTALTGAYVYDLGQRLATDKNLTRAFDRVWNTRKIEDKALSTIEQTIGKESFEFAVAGAFGGAAYKGSSAAMKLALEQPKLSLQPAEATIQSKSTMPSVGDQKQNTFFAMERSRDADFRAHERRASYGSLCRTIEKTPLPERLSDLAALIKNGDLHEAYNVVNANLGWYKERDCRYGSLQDKIANSFLRVGTNLWSAIHEHCSESKTDALEAVNEMQAKYGSETDWPLAVSSGDVHNIEITKNWSDNKRVNAIEKLVQRGYFHDAFLLAEWGWILSRDGGKAHVVNQYDLLSFEIAKFSTNNKKQSHSTLAQRLSELKEAIH
jgi:hypothetical protein